MAAPNVFLAQPKDDTLESLLSEGFAAIERRFMALDQDKAGIFTFKTLHFQLSARRLANMEKLEQVYKNVDKDNSGNLDFAEYLALLYLWAATGESLSSFFKHPQNVEVVTNAFKTMEAAWVKYDADLSRRLSYEELTNLMTNELPNLWESSQDKIEEFFPEADREGEGLKFPKYMHLLYACLHAQPDNNIPGNYTKPVGFASNEGGKDSSAWQNTLASFKALETDFDRYDTEKDGFLDLNEVTRAFPIRPNMDRLTIHTHLEGYYAMVDADNSRTLDFFEFVYLSFLMSQDGCYAHLVPGAENSGLIKMFFLRMLNAYQQADANGTRRLSKDELDGFFQAAYGFMPEEAADLFDKFCYESSSAPGEPVLDIVRVLKLLYHCVCPDPVYPVDRYEGGEKPQRHDNEAYTITADEEGESSHPDRIDPTEGSVVKETRGVQVVNSHFQGTKKLGEGGQGAVWLGEYDGHKVAAKVMHGGVTPQILADLKNEVELLVQLDHPHCHYMLGCKLMPDGEGGPLLLTEVCDEGSLFDLYNKKGFTFKDSTAWRLARECAAGFEFLHGLGYMHRDIKSLSDEEGRQNVFMGAGFVAKVADFGMASNNAVENQFMGTAQWMAPEVALCMMQPSQYDKRCDIYSYAILVWEIYHCKIPYSHTLLDQMGIARGVLTQGLRPLMLADGRRPGRSPLPPGISQFIQTCWNTDPNQRPQTFGDVLQLLEPLKPAE